MSHPIKKIRQQAVVGIVGKIGTGKSAVAKYLVGRYNFVESAFGDKLKEVVADLFDIPLYMLYSQDGKAAFDSRWGMTYRTLLQKFGTELGRSINPNVWVYHVEKWIADRPSLDVVISDVRFHTEVDMIRRVGGHVWKIVRDTGRSDAHASEAEQDSIDADIVIQNIGTLEDLYGLVDYAMGKDMPWKIKI